MSQIAVRWHLIPDGSKSIVRVKIEGEFSVNSVTATREAEEGIAKLISQISTTGETVILDKLVADRWLGDYERPEELGPLRAEREESIPSMRAQLRGERSSLSRVDPMPFFFIGGLAIAAVLGIFGLISIAQFLSEIGRGN